jgi:hypothetical protein
MWVLVVFAILILVGLLLAKYRDPRRDAARARRDEDDREFLTSATRLRARVLRSEQFGMVNLKPSFRLVLRIDGPDHVYPVETDQHVEYADVQRVRAGKVVDVWFDPKKRDRVRLCPHDIEGAEAPVDDRSDAQFLMAATRVQAKILSVSEIPQVSVDIPALSPSLWLELHVEAPAGAYDSGACVPSVGIRPLGAGDTIGVWVESKNHDRLELDYGDLAAKS